MSIAGAAIDSSAKPSDFRWMFTFCFLGLALGSAWLSVALPLSVAFAAVFLFAGPHNWFELRYALERLPARTGKLRSFFIVSGLGVVGLTGAYAALPFLLVRWAGLGLRDLDLEYRISVLDCAAGLDEVAHQSEI